MRSNQLYNIRLVFANRIVLMLFLNRLESFIDAVFAFLLRADAPHFRLISFSFILLFVVSVENINEVSKFW